jgi:hypothetical protein
MSSSLRAIVLLTVVGGITAGAGFSSLRASELQAGQPALPTLAALAQPPVGTEEQWIVEGVMNAIAGMTLGVEAPSARASRTIGNDGSSPTFRIAIAGSDDPLTVSVAGHIWAPQTYAAAAAQLMHLSETSGAATKHADLAARLALTNLSAATLLDVNERVSASLEQDPRSFSAHESAALLVGAFALRESGGMLSDVRPALTRMAAHLAMAQALRQSNEETLDGTCARGVLAALAGLQRQALSIADDISRRATTDGDHAWARALQLRVTGDWRNRPRANGETRLEQLEYARAARTRRGADAFLDYVDATVQDPGVEWQRIVSIGYSNVEASNRFSRGGTRRELDEARLVWSHYHGREITDADLIPALNDRPAQSPISRVDGKSRFRVLDWGTWAAFHQRQVCEAIIDLADNRRIIGDEDALDKLPAQLEPHFSQLRLFPVVLRWIAGTVADYDRALIGARALVTTSPELVPALVWNALLEKPYYVGRARPFPTETAWLTPAVPTGTAFDLGVRALRAGCPRPPTLAQAALWAQEMPYDHWTQWAHAYFAAGKGVPSLAVVRRAFGPLFDYDEGALMKAIEYTAMSLDERIGLTRSLCAVSTSRCPMLTELLLRDGRDLDAVKVYEQWFAQSRDRVGVANEMLWLMRYYVEQGNPSRAETIARDAASTGSARGVEVLAEFLDRSNRSDEAEQSYREIGERYRNRATSLGTYLMRRALKNGDTALQATAVGLLHEVFEAGVQPIVSHALPVRPTAGVTFVGFGKRAAAAGLEPTDVIVGVDGWRVASVHEYVEAARFSFDPVMKLTVWRKGRYQEISARIPQRWLGCRLKNFAG